MALNDEQIVKECMNKRCSRYKVAVLYEEARVLNCSVCGGWLRIAHYEQGGFDTPPIIDTTKVSKERTDAGEPKLGGFTRIESAMVEVKEPPMQSQEWHSDNKKIQMTNDEWERQWKMGAAGYYHSGE